VYFNIGVHEVTAQNPTPREILMRTSILRTGAALAAAGGLTLAMAAPASAAGHVQQDGLVNVAVGDVTILEDVNIGVAAVVAANICGVNVGPVAVLGRAVDRSGADRTVCESGGNTIRLIQN
jgi:hypothetical protein